MAALPPLAVGLDGGDVAKIVLLAIIGIVVLVERARKSRPGTESRHRADEGAARYDAHLAPTVEVGPRDLVRTPGRAPTRTHVPPGRTPPRVREGAPVPAPAGRAPGTLGGMPSDAAGAARPHLADLETTRLRSGKHPTQTAAAHGARSTEVVGRRLLFGRDLSPHDRIRSALLWHEILDPPPALTGPRDLGARPGAA